MTATIHQRTRMLTVQQLNHAQWHVVDSVGHWGSGVTNWPEAVSTALWTALLTDRGVESVSLEGDRLLLLRPGFGA
ncbi:hypothetical protein [Sphingomonas paucimobilis]|uniref:Uncharacterized protein n=1 Tax=Sphingomonas paucimobilis TaxID=13689 RepID=A0A7Y2KVR5_SPHPI|nr:hypothetical protein [Sphingomonas paucimobilis]NNG59776.1 hypothetical protein [Sphingomonas paucimobilis]